MKRVKVLQRKTDRKIDRYVGTECKWVSGKIDKWRVGQIDRQVESRLVRRA